MKIPATEAIIFDFGGVLIHLNPQATIDAFKSLGSENFESLYQDVNTPNLFTDLETGKISPQSFINRLLDHLPKGTTPNQVVKAWNAMILHIPEETIDILIELKKTHRIFLLSNTNEIHIQKALIEWERVSGKAPQDYFDHVYLSHEMGMRKPTADIFEFVCNAQNLTPENTLFIDDSAEHIATASSLGIQTIHMERNAQLQDVFS